MRNFIFIIAALCAICSVHARPQTGYYTDPVIDELRIEIDDLKHALKSTQVEINLLDERIKKDTKVGNKEPNSLTLLTAQVSTLEKKVGNLEKTLDKAANDLRTLGNSANQALTKIQGLEQDFASQEKRLDEVAKLKGTLTSISKAISQKSLPANETESLPKTYRVKAGDSLEKIARNHHTTAEALRKINNLSSDKIVVNQELRLE